MSSKVVAASDRLYRLLLHVYPRSYYDEYSTLMAQTFHDMAAADYASHGMCALARVWFTTIGDLAISATKEHFSERSGRQIVSQKSIMALILALVFSIITGYVDLTATETYAPMSCILVFSFMAGFIQPKGAWRWALLIGLSICISTFVGLAINFNFADAPPRFPITLVVLVIPALVAAYAGVFANRIFIGWQGRPTRLS
ncbi:MAG: hypothetical protein R3E39_21095 [Anaerolineae bacterium]